MNSNTRPSNFSQADEAKIIEFAKAKKSELFCREETVLKIVRQIGFFSKVEVIKGWRHGQSESNVFLIDDKWQVTMTWDEGNRSSIGATVNSEWREPDSFVIEDYAKIRAQQKESGRTARKRSEATGVPFDIAFYVDHIKDDEKAKKILTYIKEAKKDSSKKELLDELRIDRDIRKRFRVTTLANILTSNSSSENIWDEINGQTLGKKKLNRLMNYLLNEEE